LLIIDFDLEDTLNIFATSDDPLACAEALDDKRLIKMILESAQILCTVVGGAYKATHENHPCVVWARSSSSNALWLYAHAIYMCEEFSKRFAKIHKSQEVIEETFKRLYSLPDTRPDKSDRGKYFPIEWVNVSGVDGDLSVFEAYRICLNNKWDNDTRVPVWTNRKPPFWARRRYARVNVNSGPISFRNYYFQKNRKPKEAK
jgi:hypothetical protein